MNVYWVTALIILLGGVATGGYRFGYDAAEVACQKHDEAQQQVTIAAQNGVISTIGKQQTITTEVENAHHSGVSVIDNMYRLYPAPTAFNNLPAVSGSAGRSDGAAGGSSRTKYYKLTAQECDDNTDQLLDLQDWVRGQSAVK